MVGQWCFFNDLQPNGMNVPAVKARLIRCYGKPLPSNDQELNSFESIFHDEHGTRYHFTAKKNCASKYKDMLREGQVYRIRNFGVTHNTSKYRVTSHYYKAYFYGNTEVIEETNPDFPNFVYAFKSFDEIFSIENIAEAIPFDVIGRLVYKGHPTETVDRNGINKRVVDVLLHDDKGNKLFCTLWEEFVNEWMRIYDQHNEEVNIMVLQFCRPTVYHGTLKVSNDRYATKILLNPNVPEVHEFKERLFIDPAVSTLDVVSTSQVTRTTISDELRAGVNVLTIKELCDGDQDGSFWILGTIVNVDGSEGWYYIACKKCNKKVSKVDHRFYCKNCNNYSEGGKMRYKMVISVADESSSTTFFLWDTEGRKVIGKSAEEINLEMTEVVGSLSMPKEINEALLRKKFMFKIKVAREESRKYNNCPYSVLSLSSDPNVMAMYNNMDCQESNSINQLEISNGEANKVSQETPTVSQSGLEVQSECAKDGAVKRNLIDEFSATKAEKKAKFIIKQEKN